MGGDDLTWAYLRKLDDPGRDGSPVAGANEAPVADLGVDRRQRGQRDAVVLGDLRQRVAGHDDVDLQRDAR